MPTPAPRSSRRIGRPVANRRVGRPAAATSALVRTQILKAARDGFARNGYRATSMRSLAADAGVATPSIYHHFGSKAGLFVAAHRDADQQVQDALRDGAQRGGSLSERLGHMVDALGALHRDDASIAAMLSVGQLELARSAELVEAHQLAGGPVESVIVQVVDAAFEAGEVSAKVSKSAVVDLLTAHTLGVAMYSSVAAPDDVDGSLLAWRLLLVGELFEPDGHRPR